MTKDRLSDFLKKIGIAGALHREIRHPNTSFDGYGSFAHITESEIPKFDGRFDSFNEHINGPEIDVSNSKVYSSNAGQSQSRHNQEPYWNQSAEFERGYGEQPQPAIRHLNPKEAEKAQRAIDSALKQKRILGGILHPMEEMRRDVKNQFPRYKI